MPSQATGAGFLSLDFCLEDHEETDIEQPLNAKPQNTKESGLDHIYIIPCY